MFEEQLQRLAAQSLNRRLIELASPSGPVVTIAGRPIILLSSNDYLGLANHPDVVQAAVRATQTYGAGAGASRLICGTLPPHRELETALAAFKQAPAALVFGCGYLANLGLIAALIGRGGLILADRLCHASLVDACRLSGAEFRIYRHGDIRQVEALLSRRRAGRRTLIVTDGLFSMDGDVAPLPDLAALAARHDALLYVDDAHGTGVMGATGRGTIEQFGLEDKIPFHMGTLGKALGSSGAYVVGPHDLIDYLISTCRPFMFTTAPPPGSMAAAAAALAIIRREPDRRTRLWHNRRYLLEGLQALGFRLTATASPILPVLVGAAAQAVAMSERLYEQGVFVPAIRPPTVPAQTSRLRVTVTSEHTPEQLDEALRAFREAGRAVGLV